MRLTSITSVLLVPLVASCSSDTARGGKTSGNAGAAGGSDAGVGGAAAEGGLGGSGIGGIGGVVDASIDREGAAGQGGAAPDGGTSVIPGYGWQTLPSLMKKRQAAMAVAVADTMYVIGGFDESGFLADVERLDPAQTGWTAAPSLPTAQCCAAAGALGNVIAVAGGYGADGQTPTNALLLFDTTTGMWQPGPPMPTARVNAMGAVWNGKLAVIGGSTQFGSMQPTGVIEIYDPVAKSWATSPLTVTPRAGGVAVTDADQIYVIGGADQSSLYGLSLVEIVSAGGVTAGPPVGLARVQVAGGLLPAGLAVAGGWTPQYDSPSAEGLLGARAAWQPFPPMPTSRAGAAAAVVNGKLIVAGGGQFRGAGWVQQDVVEALAAD